jgi:hypothetical protein
MKWLLTITWICLLAGWVFGWLGGRVLRKTIALKDRLIELKERKITSKDRELAATRGYCSILLEVQHDAIDRLFALLCIRDKTFLPSQSGAIWDAFVAGSRGIQLLKAETLAAAQAPQPSFECPRCHRVSFNANDIENRYCGACHTFFTPPRPLFAPGPPKPPPPPPSTEVSKGGR